MPDTKPGIRLDKDGICQACIHHQQRKNVNWDSRFDELVKLCNKYRKVGEYDCLIPVSGGKDSYYQVYVLKELLQMNPLLVSVSDPFTHTKTGEENLQNLRERYSCDLIQLHLNQSLVRKMCRLAFEKFGSPTWPIDRAIYAYPIRTAIEKKIPLVVYGENINYEYGGAQEKETPSALDQINNDVAKNIDFSLWIKNGIFSNELVPFKYPTKREIKKAKLNPVYLSYFLPWSGRENYLHAKECGFKPLGKEWIREGYIEDYDQVDSIGYLFNAWMKYPKFGFQRVTDVCGYWIRDGVISKEKAAKLIKQHDYKLDKRMWKDFISFCEYTPEEAWKIVKKHDKGFLKEKTDVTRKEVPMHNTSERRLYRRKR